MDCGIRPINENIYFPVSSLHMRFVEYWLQNCFERNVLILFAGASDFSATFKYQSKSLLNQLGLHFILLVLRCISWFLYKHKQYVRTESINPVYHVNIAKASISGKFRTKALPDITIFLSGDIFPAGFIIPCLLIYQVVVCIETILFIFDLRNNISLMEIVIYIFYLLYQKYYYLFKHAI